MILTFDNVVAWLKTQDPETRYNYVDPGDCLVCRFLSAQGYLEPSAGPYSVSYYVKKRWLFLTWKSRRVESLCPDINSVANGSWSSTYGEALARAYRIRPAVSRPTDISIFTKLLTPARERVGDLCGNSD